LGRRKQNPPSGFSGIGKNIIQNRKDQADWKNSNSGRKVKAQLWFPLCSKAGLTKVAKKSEGRSDRGCHRSPRIDNDQNVQR